MRLNLRPNVCSPWRKRRFSCSLHWLPFFMLLLRRRRFFGSSSLSSCVLEANRPPGPRKVLMFSGTRVGGRRSGWTIAAATSLSCSGEATLLASIASAEACRFRSGDFSTFSSAGRAACLGEGASSASPSLTRFSPTAGSLASPIRSSAGSCGGGIGGREVPAAACTPPAAPVTSICFVSAPAWSCVAGAATCAIASRIEDTSCASWAADASCPACALPGLGPTLRSISSTAGRGGGTALLLFSAASAAAETRAS
mmetsp:Transcript_19471/g.74721  ORF Transcript_19471/g.74721 Transcript_19471/m.74721 type:complete len:255 (+) Transcript_19471:626-1390(+)